MVPYKKYPPYRFSKPKNARNFFKSPPKYVGRSGRRTACVLDTSETKDLEYGKDLAEDAGGQAH